MLQVGLRYWRGDVFIEGATIAAEMTMRLAMRSIFAKAQGDCPVLTGFLRSSGYFGVESTSREVVGYVNYDAPYAVLVHETHPTKAKWLERAFLGYADITGQALSRAVGRLR